MHTHFCCFISAAFFTFSSLITPALLSASTQASKKSQYLHTTTQQNSQDHSAYLPNVVIVKFKTQQNIVNKQSVTNNTSLSRIIGAYQIHQLEPVLKQTTRLLKKTTRMDKLYYAYFTGSTSPVIVAKALQQLAEIEYAEPKRIHYINKTPNDSLLQQQSFFNIVQAFAAWDSVRGEQGNVVVAIIDGGTDIGHSDLVANLWTNENEVANGIDDDQNGYVDDINGWNFANNSNDPTGLPSTPGNANHGTHTGGIACAVTNNNIGVAGASWNARLMSINAGSATTDNAIFFGYEGILYAIQNGADIISLSWGSHGSPSLFEQEMIDLAVENGTLVVAAAGNSNITTLHYPSAYRNVLAVGSTSDIDTKSSFSNYGTWVDISSPGQTILSTVKNGAFSPMSGTSMACPLVAGIVALVKTKHPDWTGIQAGEQVRVTADDIDNKNPSFTGLLGKGRVNAFRAVTESSPSIRVKDVSFSDSDGDGTIEPDETINVNLKIINYLTPASNINLTLSEDDNFISLTNSSTTISSLTMMQEIIISSSFEFNVANNAPSGHTVQFTLDIVSGNYTDRDYFTLTILPVLKNIGINNIATSVTSIGKIGTVDGDNSAGGIGFVFQNGPNVLFEGGLIAGTGTNQISNAARGALSNNTVIVDDDFEVADGGDIRLFTPGQTSDQESIGIFDDSKADSPMNIRITQRTHAMNAAPNDDFILFEYTVENSGNTALNNFYLGFFYDWDIDGGNFLTNLTGYDAARKLGYAYDSGDGPTTYVGVSVLNGGNVSYRAIYNNHQNTNNPSWGIYDGFTDVEKWQAISGGVQLPSAGPSDISFVIASGPFSIGAKDSIVIGFAMVAGTDLNDLQINADSAKQLSMDILTTVDDAQDNNLPLDFSLKQNSPNPFNPNTIIQYQIARTTHVQLTIFDALGRRIRILVNSVQTPDSYNESWDGRNAAGIKVSNGIYFYRLQTNTFTETKKMLFLK